MKVQTRIASVLVLVSALALTAAGCSSDPEDPDVTAPPALEQTTEPTNEPTTEPAAEADTSQNDALDAVVAQAQASVPEVLEQFNGLYSDVTITGVYPGTLVYTYTYGEQQDAETTAAGFDAAEAQLQSTLDNQIAPGLRAAGVTESIQGTFTFNNADGSEIWSKTFTPSE